MKSPNLRGTFTALITPFNDDLSIDFNALEKIIDFQLASGVEGLVVCGSTGESATINAKEKLSLIIKTVEYCAGRVPVIAGTGSNCTQTTIDLTILAKEQGCDAVLLVAPYYNKPSQEGLFNHYLAVAEHADIPIILYNVPGRTAVNIQPETQLRLAEECKNIIATKEASGDMEQIMEIIKYAPEGFKVLSGDDALAVPIAAMGGDGVISVLSNYAPKLFGDAVRFALEGKMQSALELHYKLSDLMKLNFIETNPVPVKTALSLMGYCKEHFRLPLLPIQPANKDIIKEEMSRAGLI